MRCRRPCVWRRFPPAPQPTFRPLSSKDSWLDECTNTAHQFRQLKVEVAPPIVTCHDGGDNDFSKSGTAKPADKLILANPFPLWHDSDSKSCIADKKRVVVERIHINGPMARLPRMCCGIPLFHAASVFILHRLLDLKISILVHGISQERSRK